MNLLWLTFFLLKRLFLSIVTIVLKDYVYWQIFMMIQLQMMVLVHLFNYFPMNSRSLNMMECLNEFFVLVYSYFLFLFTDLVANIETRYYIGDILTTAFYSVLAMDVFIIFCQLVFHLLNYLNLQNQKRSLIEE